MTTTESTRPEAKYKREASFESKLGEGRQRFLAHVIEHGLLFGRRSPEDFIRHFTPAAIMHGLREQPQLRANILVIATGVRPKIALKKTAESCGNDLQIALDEGETDAETIAQLVDPDDRVRYLDEHALWAYVTEGSFWTIEAKDKARHGVAADHVAYMLDRALKDRLITHKDIVEGITVAKLAELLPRGELEKILSAALKAGNTNKPYVESNLLAVTPATTIVKHIPLAWIWDNVISPKIAHAHGYVAKSDAPKAEAPKVEAPKAEAPKAEARIEAKIEAPRIEVKVDAPKVEPPRIDRAAELSRELTLSDDSDEVVIDAVAEPSDPSGNDLDLEIDDVLGDLASPAPRIEARSDGKVPRPGRR
jgi:hypothetical protein